MVVLRAPPQPIKRDYSLRLSFLSLGKGIESFLSGLPFDPIGVWTVLFFSLSHCYYLFPHHSLIVLAI